MTPHEAVASIDLIGESSYTERLEELRDAYLRGAIGAEEYGRLRQEVVTGQPAAEAPAAPPPPRPRRPPEELDLPPGVHVVEPAPFVPAVPVAPSTTTLDPWSDPITGQRLASWGRRAAAWLIDLLLIAATYIPTFLWAASTEDPITGELDPAVSAVLTLQLVFLPTLYTWLMVGVRGATMGKLTVGIVVRRGKDGSKIGFLRALGRVMMVNVLGILILPLLVSYLWPLFDRRAQTLHDKVVDSIVVMEKR